MLSRVQAVAKFINSTRLALGEGDSLAATQKEQGDQLIQYINQSVNFDVDDAAAAITALKSDIVSQAFTLQQLRLFAEAIAAKASVVPEQPSALPKRTAAQIHYHFQNYLTVGDWKVLGTRRSDLAAQVHILLQRAHAIGLVYPTELTIAAIVSIIRFGCEMPDQTVHFYVQEYKRLNKLRRAPAMRTVSTFPKNPAEFMSEFPRAYDANDGPVQCPYDELTCDSARSTTAARKNHRSLASSSLLAPPAMQQPTSMNTLDAFAMSLMRHMNFSRQPGAIQVLPTQPARRLALPAPPQLAAIADGNATDVEEEKVATPATVPTTPSPSGKRPHDTLDAALDEVRSALNAKSEAAAAGRKQARKRKADDTEGPAKAAPMKKPAAAPAPKKATSKPTAPAHKKATSKPTVSIVKCRSCVTARTGVPGDGMTKTVQYKGSPAKAKAEVTEWLRCKCDELGIDCPY